MDTYDPPWKDAITHFFPDFMAFYFPQAHAGIDWSQPCEFLEQELAELTHDGEPGKRILDKLVRVHALDGAQSWILVHLELQGGRVRDFAERVFTYHYRLYDRYRQPLASLVLLTDRHPRWRPHAFAYQRLGCVLRLDFPSLKLLDYAPRVDALLEDPNPFALVTAAHLLTQKTRKDAARRYQEKRRLTRLLYQRGWDKRSIINLYYVIDWMMRLPVGLEQDLRSEIEAWEREGNVRYISSIERLSRAEGVREGKLEGKREGRQEGVLLGKTQGRAELLAELLSKRFDCSLRTIRSRMKGATDVQLDCWAGRLLSARTLDEVFREE